MADAVIKAVDELPEAGYVVDVSPPGPPEAPVVDAVIKAVDELLKAGYVHDPAVQEAALGPALNAGGPHRIRIHKARRLWVGPGPKVSLEHGGRRFEAARVLSRVPHFPEFSNRFGMDVYKVLALFEGLGLVWVYAAELRRSGPTCAAS